MKTLYRAARVRTLAHPETGEWLMIDGRHVQRIGSGEPPTADRVVDLPGATIVPGFVDAHVHLTTTGLSLANQDVAAARSADELLAAIQRRTAQDEGSEAVFLLGYDESRWDRPELPTMAQLDSASARPLIVRRVDGHAALANRAALEGSGALELPGVARNDAGEPTGTVTGQANETLGRWALVSIGDHERQDLQLRAASLAASMGVTAVHEMSMPAWHGDRDLEVLLSHRGRLPVDALPIVATMDLGVAISHGLSSIGGDLSVDGSIGAGTAWLSAPDLDGNRGTGSYSDDELAEFFHSGHSAGLQVGVHAIGDAAIDQVISVWERVYQALDSRERRHFRARRHRIEHFELPSSEHVERAAMLGLAASVQPAFDTAWGQAGGLYERRLGPGRGSGMNPFRSMLDRGVEVGVGSDAPITPLDPMAAIEALERHHDPAQRLSRVEAIRLHTTGSARIGHQEAKKGALAPGMHADFAAYDVDPFEEPAIEGLRSILTVSLGREVHVA